MLLCGHRFAAMIILWTVSFTTYVRCQKPSSVTKRHDVYIAGFFPFTPIDSPETRTGRGVMPAVKLAVEHINDSPTVLRNYRLHMWWNDTQVIFETFFLPRVCPRSVRTFRGVEPGNVLAIIRREPFHLCHNNAAGRNE